MNIEELVKKLRISGITLSPSTIRRWAQSDVVTSPIRRHRCKGEGRGKISDWSQQSLEEISGFWAVQHYGWKGFVLLKRTHEAKVIAAKKLAKIFYADPINWQLERMQQLFDHYANQFPDDWKALGEDIFEEDLWNFTTWVTAVEKVKHGWQISQAVYCDFVFLYDGNLNDRTLRYGFFGVRLERIEEPKQPQIRVKVHKRDVFTKAYREFNKGNATV